VETPARTAALPLSIPEDSTLLPLFDGMLLVSRDHAVFCRVGADEVAPVARLLRGESDVATLAAPLRERLELHGFFGPPRPSEEEPPLVQLQLTNACNLACSYCCTDSGPARAGELDLDRLLEIVATAHRVLGPRTRFAILGGEPLLSRDALPLADAIVGLGHRLTLFTNGTLLADPAIARAVAALSNRGVEVRVSLAGAAVAECDGLSGGERFDRVLAGLRALAEAGGEAVVDLVLTPRNSRATARDLHALRQRLPEGCELSLAVLYLGGRERGQQLFGSQVELERALDEVTFEAGEAVPVERPSPLAFRREACSCVLGSQIAVRSDGALFTCFKMVEQVGHVERDGFEAALEWARANPQPATGYPLCADCALATLCGGGCRTENKLYTGDGGTPVCGPWRKRVLCELLAEDVTAGLDWPAEHLLREAHARGIDAPAELRPTRAIDRTPDIGYT